MKKTLIRLAGATALLALSVPALADKTDALITNQYREKIAVARAEPGVAQYGAAELDKASERIARLDKKLDNDKSGQAEAVAGEIDTLIETARTRAKVAMMKKDLDGARAAAADRTNAKVENAQASVAAAQADAASARAEADRMKQAMRDYQLKQTQFGATLVLQDVVFQTGKADLKPGSAERLRPLASYLQANPNVKVRIDGHTDSQGSDSFNQTLSEQRAQAVRTALGGMGVTGDRVTAVGHGEASPVADNMNAAGRQQNRRVEVTLVGEQAASFAAVN